LVIATTNSFKDVDPSLRRGGRLDFEVRFDMPTAEDRFEILKAHLGKYEFDIENDELKYIANAASGFVSSDLASIVRNAHLKQLRLKESKISMKLLQ